MSKERGFLRALDGCRLHWTSWGLSEIDADAPIAVLIHGYAEHLGRYGHVAAMLNDLGIGVVAIDVRGHGQSEGKRGYVSRYDEYLVDVGAAFDLADRLHPGGKRILIGHSNGGLIGVRYALCESGRRPDVMILSGALLGLALEVPAWKERLARGMSKVAPEMTLPSDLDPSALTHDKAISDAYAKDSLVFSTATARFYTEMQDAIDDTFRRAHTLTLPSLILAGGADPINDPGCSRRLSNTVGSEDVEYIEYDGMLHEIFNEVDRDKVFGDMTRWLRAHDLVKAS